MASNNFFLNNDPLLYTQTDYSRQLADFDRLRQQQSYDFLGELDELVKNTGDISNELQSNGEYAQLSSDLQSMIQQELMSQVRWKLNTNPTAVGNMKRQMEIIKNVARTKESEQRKNLDEINDYIKNHSDITFDEYKRSKRENNGTKKEKK